MRQSCAKSQWVRPRLGPPFAWALLCLPPVSTGLSDGGPEQPAGSLVQRVREAEQGGTHRLRSRERDQRWGCGGDGRGL